MKTIDEMLVMAKTLTDEELDRLQCFCAGEYKDRKEQAKKRDWDELMAAIHKYLDKHDQILVISEYGEEAVIDYYSKTHIPGQIVECN